jgi:nucleoside-diphosphate-sugar epimerase
VNIWITGSGGRLGSVLVSHLLHNGVRVTALTRDHLSPIAREDLANVSKISKPDCFIHLASNLTPRGSSAEKVLSDALETLDLDRFVYKFCALHRIPLIYTSTYFIYSARHVPWRESEFDFSEPTAIGDRQIYALVKAQVSREIVNQRSHGEPFSTVILPNIIGGHVQNNGRLDHLPEKALALVIESLRDRKKVIDIGQGDGRRLQFVSPSEISRWLYQVLDTNMKLPELTHLASTESFTPLDLFRSITRNMKVDIEVVGNDLDGAISTTIDDSMARSSLDWNGGKSLDDVVEQWLSTQNLELSFFGAT